MHRGVGIKTDANLFVRNEIVIISSCLELLSGSLAVSMTRKKYELKHTDVL